MAKLAKAVSAFNLYWRSMTNLLANCGLTGCLHKWALKGRLRKKKKEKGPFLAHSRFWGRQRGSFTLVIWDAPCTKFLSPQAIRQSHARTPIDHFQLTSICRMSQTSLMNKMIDVWQQLHKANESSLQRAYTMHSSARGTFYSYQRFTRMLV